MSTFIRIFLGLYFLAPAVLAATTADYEREKRLANQIVDSIMDGEPLYLDASGRKFLAIDMEPDTDASRGGVIILHGRGYHPDWEDVARPLRIGLAETGWRTLSLQMPVLHKQAKYFDYLPILHEAFPRIEAGIDYLKNQGIRKVVLIAHSCSVHMAMAWLKETGAPGIHAYVGIGMGATDYQQPMAAPLPLERLAVPVLDVYGGNDYPAVHRLAIDRWMAIRAAGHPESRQIVVPGADHYFHNMGTPLLGVISDWLDRQPGMAP